jgi:hypothetical protein
MQLGVSVWRHHQSRQDHADNTSAEVDHCAKVRLSHVLRHHMAQGPLPKCLRVMHLAWEGPPRANNGWFLPPYPAGTAFCLPVLVLPRAHATQLLDGTCRLWMCADYTVPVPPQV